MAFHRFSSDDDESASRRPAHFNPTQVDNSLRMALQLCWMLIPEDRRTPDEVERQFRRLVDRALKDMREDDEAFGNM